MPGADDLMRQANTLAEKLRRYRGTSHRGQAPDAGEVAAMEARLASLWTAIRAARATAAQPMERRPDQRTRPRWD